MNRRRQNPLSEQRAVQRGVLAPPVPNPPTDGITSSAELLARDIDKLHAHVATIIDVRAREIATAYHLQDNKEIVAEIYKRLRG
jgi:hypothetical protein